MLIIKITAAVEIILFNILLIQVLAEIAEHEIDLYIDDIKNNHIYDDCI